MFLNTINLGFSQNPPPPRMVKGPIPTGTYLGPKIEGLSEIEPIYWKLKPLPLTDKDPFIEEEQRRKFHEMMNHPGAIGAPLSMMHDEINQRQILDKYKLQQIELLNLKDEAEIIKAAELMGVLPGTIRNMQMIAEDAAGVQNNIQEQILQRRAERTLEMAQSVMSHPDVMARHQMRRLLNLPDETPQHAAEQNQILQDIRDVIERPLQIPPEHSEMVRRIAEEMGQREIIAQDVEPEHIIEIAELLIPGGTLPRTEGEAAAGEGAAIMEIAAKINGEAAAERPRELSEILSESINARTAYDELLKMHESGQITMPVAFKGAKYDGATNKKSYETNIRELARRLEDRGVYSNYFARPIDVELNLNSQPAERVKLLHRMANILQRETHGTPGKY